MKTNLKTCLLFFLWSTLLSIHSFGSFSELGLEVDYEGSSTYAVHGYGTHRFTVKNTGKVTRIIHIAIPDEIRAFTDSRQTYIQELTQTLSVSPGEHVFHVYQPPVNIDPYARSIKVTCEEEELVLRDSKLHSGGYYLNNTGYSQRRTVLISGSRESYELEKAVKAMLPPITSTDYGYPGYRLSDFVHFLNSPVDLLDWPKDWLAFGSWDMVLLTGQEWKRIPQEVQSALFSVVLAGSHLVIQGEGFTPPEGWPVTGDPSAGYQEIGFGKISVLPDDDSTVNESVATLLGADDPRKNLTAIPLLGALDSNGNSHVSFPILEGANDALSVQIWLAVLAVFILLAGPVNLLFLMKIGKREWFLWTFPVITLGASFVVIFIVFLREGTQPSQRSHAVTLLNQTSQQALTLGRIGIYAPIAPSTLKFSGNTEITPLFAGSPNYNNDWDTGSSRRIHWTAEGEQWFRGKWTGSRVPAHFAIRKIENRKENIAVDWSDSSPEIGNHLGIPLDQLFIRNSKGELFSGTNISVEQKVTLIPVEEESGIAPGPFSSFAKYVGDLRLEPKKELMKPELLPANTYWAIFSSASPFLENPLRGKKAKHRDSGHIIGILEEVEK